jgi:hypothetical protein
MRPVDLDALAAVARQLDQLGVPYAFTGGIAIGFLLDHPHLTTLRPTGDVDAIAAVVTRIQHTALEEQLRQLGFHHASSEGAPICRWLYHGTKVDVMPAKDTAGQKSNPWFEHALRTASIKTLRQVTVRVVSAPCFVATKLVAFADRGKGDFYGSHDLEDVVTVVDGRGSLGSELAAEDEALRRFVSSAIRHLLGLTGFVDALPGHLESDEASQQRLPLLLNRLQAIATLSEPNP